MFADKYPSIFSRQMEAIVYISVIKYLPTKPVGIADRVKTMS